MRTLVVSAIALAAATATPALAQDGDFTGPHAEVVAGWDHVSADGEGQSGFTYGGSIGYDYQIGSLVVGVSGEVTGSTTDRSFHDVATAGDTLKSEAGRDYYAGGRIGYVVMPQTLVYGSVGYTNARVNYDYNTGTNVGNFERHDDLDGIRLGAGIERDFGPFLGKIEYRYSNYEQDFSRHQVLAGLGVRF